jgi:carbon-monoxide dehydrogenase medium subunit
MHNINYHAAATAAEAVSLLSSAEDAALLAGGQTLLPTMKARLAAPSDLVDISRAEDLRGISLGDETVTIGAMTTHAEVAGNSDLKSVFPALCDLAGRIGDPAVRHRGTIGGSLANNDPAACYPSAVLGTGATISTNKRDIAADEYFQGMFATSLDAGEVITSITFPIPEAANYHKFAQPASRFALVGVFVAKFPDCVRVAVTGASEEGVYRWTDAETALASDFSAEAVGGLSVRSQGMISDLHGDGTYRANLVRVMTARAVAAAS